MEDQRFLSIISIHNEHKQKAMGTYYISKAQ